MSSKNSITINAENRQILGKGLKQLRQNGKIPAVIHNHGQASLPIMIDQATLLKAYANAGKHHPVEVKLDDNLHLTLIKDVDIEPLKQHLRHVVFQAIRQNQEVEAEIPVIFKPDSEIPAEKISLMVLRQLDNVMVKALPKNLPDQLIVDPSKLAEVGDHITVADIEVPEGVTILTDPEHPIATVEMPKDQIAEADAAAAALAEDAATTETESTETASPEVSDGESQATEAATEKPSE